MQEKFLIELFRESNLTVSRALHVKLNKNWNFHSTGIPHSRFYFIIDGGGFIKTENQYIELKPGNVYFIPPNRSFSCGCEYMEKIFFHINISTLEKYDLLLDLDKIYTLPYSLNDIYNLKKLMNSDNYIDIITLKMLLLKTVIDFSSAFSFNDIAIKKHSRLIQSVILYIEDNISVKLRVADISKALFISESKIRNAFLKEMDMPIGKYMDDMIFIKARKMLSIPTNTISSISSELGFCDQFYFSRRFKEIFGITPTEFRKKNKINLNY